MELSGLEDCSCMHALEDSVFEHQGTYRGPHGRTCQHTRHRGLRLTSLGPWCSPVHAELLRKPHVYDGQSLCCLLHAHTSHHRVTASCQTTTARSSALVLPALDIWCIVSSATQGIDSTCMRRCHQRPFFGAATFSSSARPPQLGLHSCVRAHENGTLRFRALA